MTTPTDPAAVAARVLARPQRSVYALEYGDEALILAREWQKQARMLKVAIEALKHGPRDSMFGEALAEIAAVEQESRP